MKTRPSAILMYHSLDGSGSPVSITPEMFRTHMRIRAGMQVPVVPLHAAPQTPGAVAITFDDGFASFADQALPELVRYGFPAAVFAVSGFCGRQNDWPGQPPGIPVLPLMSWSALGDAAAAGIEVGAHTVSHPRLDRMAASAALAEIEDSAREIEQRLGRPVRSFSYPYGTASADARATVSERFSCAVSTELAFARPSSDPWWLPRIDAYYFQSEARFRQLFTATGAIYVRARRGLRQIRSATRFGA